MRRRGRGRGGDPVAADEDAFEDLLRVAAAIESAEEMERLVDRMPAPVRRRMYDAWGWQAHGGQRVPRGDWRAWLLMAGRGFGKTRAGAEWVWARARAMPAARIALVGANLDDVAKVMVDGPSGIRRCARTGEWVRWVASQRTAFFSTGAIGLAYSGETPGKLRGPEHHFAWCDEIAKWAYPDESWDNLILGLRAGAAPQVVVTTTPRAIPIVRRLGTMPGCVTTRGRTGENSHLPDIFITQVTGLYAGTRLGRQELDGELLADVEGALWPRALIESSRWRLEDGALPAREDYDRVVVGVDPPAGVGGDACGIVVTGRRGETGFVLADASVAGASPEGWAAAVARAARGWRAGRVVAEVNQGGRMVESVLRAVEPGLPLDLVHASDSKVRRAEPVAALFERGLARFAGAFPELEDELAGLTRNGGYEGPGRSPDRADALVWAMTELMLNGAGEPRVALL